MANPMTNVNANTLKYLYSDLEAKMDPKDW